MHRWIVASEYEDFGTWWRDFLLAFHRECQKTDEYAYPDYYLEEIQRFLYSTTLKQEYRDFANFIFDMVP